MPDMNLVASKKFIEALPKDCVEILYKQLFLFGCFPERLKKSFEMSLHTNYQVYYTIHSLKHRPGGSNSRNDPGVRL